MRNQFILLFIVVPLVELALLIKLGEAVGFWPAFALVVATGITGGVLARREGLSILGRLQRKLAGGELPGRELVDGAIVLASGALLITPGVLTDVVGLAGLFPLSRAWIRARLVDRFRRALERGTIRVNVHGGGTTRRDGEDWVDIDEG